MTLKESPSLRRGFTVDARRIRRTPNFTVSGWSCWLRGGKYWKVLFHLILFFIISHHNVRKGDKGGGNRKTSKLGKGDEKGISFCLLLVISFRK